MLNKFIKYHVSKKTVLIKMVIALFSVIVIMAGTLTVSFANEDLNVVLNKWFDEKRMNAIVHIKEGISTEKDTQKIRLQEEIKKEMAIAESELDQFTEAEKRRRIQNLRAHTDQLISQIDIDNSSAEQQLVDQLNTIYAEAKKAMNTANDNWKSSVAPVVKEEPPKSEEKKKEKELIPNDPPAPAPAPAPPKEVKASEPAEPEAEESTVEPEPTPEPPPIAEPLPAETPEDEVSNENPAGDGE